VPDAIGVSQKRPTILESTMRVPPKSLRAIGWMVFAAGVLIAAIVYWNSADLANADDSLTRRDVYELQKFGGKEYVITTEMNSFLSNLWHGRRLAGTILVISSGVCSFCLIKARRATA
jgi:hypothetical protein